MAFMYPFHAPSLPMKWDDPVWAREICPSMEHALLAVLDQKRTNQVRQEINGWISVCLILEDHCCWGTSLLCDLHGESGAIQVASNGRVTQIVYGRCPYWLARLRLLMYATLTSCSVAELQHLHIKLYTFTQY